MEKRYSEYFCRRIKSERLKQKFSLDSLSQLTKISKGYLSKIENLEYNPSELFLKNIYGKLGIDLAIGVKKIQELTDKLETLHHSIVFYDEAKAKQLYEELITEWELYQYSPILIRYILVIYIYLNSFEIKNKNIARLERYLIKLENEISFAPEECQLYYDCFGISYWNKNQYKNSIDYFKKALSYGEISNITSMVYYYLGKSLYRLNRLLEAFVAYENASKAFVTECNFKRLWFTQSHIAILYFNNKQFDETLRIELSLLNSIGMDEYKKVVKRNYIWCLINDKKYDLALRTIETISNEEQNPIICFYAAWCYFRTDYNEQSIEWIEKGFKIAAKNSIEYVLIEVTNLMVKNKSRSIIKELQSILIKNRKIMDNEDIEFVNRLIIEKAEEFHMYKVADTYYQYLFNSLFH